jgi:hypothetical protein
MAKINMPSPAGLSARRVSYTIKSRLTRHAVPLSVGALFVLALITLGSLGRSSPVSDDGRLRRYGRTVASTVDSSTPADYHPQEDMVYPSRRQKQEPQAANGVSFLTMDEDELIAEDDLLWDTLAEAHAQTAEEQADEAEAEARRAEVHERARVHSLQALVYWLAEGGVISANWQVPTGKHLRKIGGRGVEKMLTAMGGGAEFEEGWIDHVRDRFRVVVFSKVGWLVRTEIMLMLVLVDLLPILAKRKVDPRKL